MYSFENDYSEGIHPQILKAMVEANLVQTPGYGTDKYCEHARNILKERLGATNVDVHFLVGGTQTNKTCLAAMLKPYEAVIAADSSHINNHETGAIEANGHKILTVPAVEGKITPEMIQVVLYNHTDEHKVKPRVVFISNTTELGTIYTLSELTALREFCTRNDLLLYMDGARFGAALTCSQNDVSMSDLVKLFDAFYIGGTKNGALFGEAVVLVNESIKPDFRYYIKQNGGLFAKSKFLGIQFIELFQGNLYLELASHANRMGLKVKEAFLNNGFHLYADSYTNQQFIIMPNNLIPIFDQKYVTSIELPYDQNHSVVRFVTSWATNENRVIELANDIKLIREQGL